MKKTLYTLLALAIAIAFSPLPDLQAAPLVSPDSRAQVDNLTHSVKAKKKAKRSKKRYRKGKRARSKGPGRCGAYMYYSKKARKCMDARNKK